MDAPTTGAVVDTPPPPPPAPTTEIHVTPATVADKGPAPTPPKKGSAADRMMGELRKRAGIEEETTPAAHPKTEAKTEIKPPAPKSPEPSAAEPKPTEDGGKAPAPDALSAEEKKKVSPWKLVEQYKSRMGELEKQIADAKTTGLAETEKKTYTEKLAAHEKRMAELEEEIRYVNYAKSQEYQDKYVKPYEQSWMRWMDELKEITVAGDNGQELPFQPQHLLELVNMPLGKAREQANQMFGDFADDVMAARKEIRGLFDAQNKALEDARKNGAAREKARSEQWHEGRKQLESHLGQLWNAHQNEALNDEKYGAYFKPIEGDEEGNQALQKGFELARSAFARSVFDPSLKPEERAELVRRHVAVVNRAAAFGRLSHQNLKMAEELKSLKAELAKYTAAQPGAGEGDKTSAAPQHMSAKEALFAELAKRAH